MWGLGKPRSKLGKFLDENGIKQNKLEKNSGVSQTIIGELANGKERNPPSKATKTRILRALRRMTDNEDLDESDLF